MFIIIIIILLSSFFCIKDEFSLDLTFEKVPAEPKSRGTDHSNTADV